MNMIILFHTLLNKTNKFHFKKNMIIIFVLL